DLGEEVGRRGGPMTLAKSGRAARAGGPHDPGEKWPMRVAKTPKARPHDAGDWQRPKRWRRRAPPWAGEGSPRQGCHESAGESATAQGGMDLSRAGRVDRFEPGPECVRIAAHPARTEYRPRRPDQTPLHRVVREQIETFLEQVHRDRAVPLPKYVE